MTDYDYDKNLLNLSDNTPYKVSKNYDFLTYISFYDFRYCLLKNNSKVNRKNFASTLKPRLIKISSIKSFPI